MKLEDLLRRLEYRYYLMWCIRYPKLLAHRCKIGQGSRLNIGPEASIHFGHQICFMDHFTCYFYGRITIGDRVFFQENCHISVHEELTIGDYSIFGEGVSIHDENHIVTAGSDPISDRDFIVKPISIGRNVWVGAKATILPGVHIGDNAVIGANAVVTQDVPAYTIVGGIPARTIRAIDPSSEFSVQKINAEIYQFRPYH
jgi:acetyltransferase-like isoleucine patch superfamily enzyme